MGYGKLIQKRKVQAERAAGIEAPCHVVLPQSDAPVFSVFFAIIVSGITGLIWSVFFAYNWFKCLNYLIGRKLFKAPALATVWAVCLGLSVLFVFLESSWLLFFAWMGRIAFIMYLLTQLRRCAIHEQTVMRRLKIYSWVLYGLWFLCVLYIWRCGCSNALHYPYWRCDLEDYVWRIVVFPAFVILEICLVQRMFNLVVCAVSEHGLLDAKFAVDWRIFRIVAVWAVIGLSVLLFLWDIGVSAWNADREFGLDGMFRFWSFCEGYSPHASWQLYLWLTASLSIFLHSELAKNYIDAIMEFFSKENLKRAWMTIRQFFSEMFPNVSNEKETEV